MIKENRKFRVDFKSDVLFKYALSNDKDQDSLFLLDLIIRDIIGIDYSSLKILNPEIDPSLLNNKEIVLDILLEDHYGRKIDIEMQKSSLSSYLYQRFQFYGAKLLTEQLNEGDTYGQLRAVYQVIFIDDINPSHPCLKEVYTSRNDQGSEEKCNLIHRIYIFIPYINEIKKQKPLKEFSSLEKMIYIFANSIDNDIMEVEERVVKVMEKKLRAFTKEESLAYIAFQRYMGRWQAHWEKEEAKIEGRQEGREEGRQEGRIVTLTQLLQNKYPQQSLSFMERCSLEQLDSISKHLFDDISLEQLKKLINEERDTL